MKRNKYIFGCVFTRPVLLILFFGVTLSLKAQNNIKISYVGNMGVVIGNHEHSVIIDGFHKKYKPSYLFPSDSLVNRIIDGEHGNFKNIEIAIATHHHQDHFDADYFRAYLDRNPRAIAILSPQILDLLKKDGPDTKFASDSKIKVAHFNGLLQKFDNNEIEIKTFRCDHVNPIRHKTVENMAYLVRIDGISVLHVGDTDWDVAEKHFMAHQNTIQSVDVVILPYWMLLEVGSSVKLKRFIHANHIIATHIPPDFDKTLVKSIYESFEHITLFTEIGQTVDYSNTD